MIYKGQNLRLMIDSKCIAVAKSCDININNETEDANNKDVEGGWDNPGINMKSWSINANALVVLSDEGANSTIDLIVAMLTPKKVSIDVLNTTGSMNREGTSGKWYEGTAYITDLTISAPDHQDADISITLTGDGALS